MGDSEPPDILYETCACIIHTVNLQLHVHLLKHSMINLSLKIDSDSKPPVTGYPRTKDRARPRARVHVHYVYMCFVKL